MGPRVHGKQREVTRSDWGHNPSSSAMPGHAGGETPRQPHNPPVAGSSPARPTTIYLRFRDTEASPSRRPRARERGVRPRSGRRRTGGHAPDLPSREVIVGAPPAVASTGSVGSSPGRGHGAPVGFTACAYRNQGRTSPLRTRSKPASRTIGPSRWTGLFSIAEHAEHLADRLGTQRFG